jgi:hypothetical protein
VSGWGDFAVVIGASTASLLGLLFVAVSFRGETIAGSAELRNRSAQTLSLLLTGLLVAALLVVPDQQKWVLGTEYLALALVATYMSYVLDQRAGGRGGSAIGRRLASINPTWITCSLLALAALFLLLGHGDGLYVLVPALFAVLVGGVVNAWLILVRLTA